MHARKKGSKHPALHLFVVLLRYEFELWCYRTGAPEYIGERPQPAAQQQHLWRRFLPSVGLCPCFVGAIMWCSHACVFGLAEFREQIHVNVLEDAPYSMPLVLFNNSSYLAQVPRLECETL